MEIDDGLFSEEYKIPEGTDDTEQEKELEEIGVDTESYPIAKPKRIIIRTKIIHDQS
jgi:hypothetical protein